VSGTDDLYAYPGTEVLVNLVGLRDPDETDRYERWMSLFRRCELEEDSVQGDFDLDYVAVGKP
jgi:fido (protein-threonine AMPylation protein)